MATARKDQGLTQQQLGERLGLDPSAVSRLEKGERKLSVPELVGIAEALGRPLTLFVSDAAPAIVSRRSNPNASHGSTDQLDRELQMFESDVRTLLSLRLLRGPGRDVTARTPKNHRAAENMAWAMRQRLGLGAAPIDDLGSATASLGLYSYVAELGADGPDGGCVAVEEDGTPGAGVAVINGDLPSGRRRMTLAHELGHWLSGDAFDAAATDAERMISSFAIHFLMPRAGVASAWQSAAPLRERCLRLAAEFQVSWSAALGQLSNLNLISRPEFRSLSAQEPRRGEFVQLGVGWTEDMRSPYIAPLVAQAAVDGYVSGKLTMDRVVGILRGTLGPGDLPEVSPLTLDDLRPAFSGHGA